MENYLNNVMAVIILANMVFMSCSNFGDEVSKEGKLRSLDTIFIKGMAFIPEKLYVQEGDTVVWLNEDIVPHNIASFPGNEWVSDTLSKDQTWKKVIKIDLDYFCNIHPTMKGNILLKSYGD